MRKRFEVEAELLTPEGGPICDFCSTPLRNEGWTYPTTPHEYGVRHADQFVSLKAPNVLMLTPEPPEGRKKGAWVQHYIDRDGLWGACDTCHDLIEAGDRKRFLEFALAAITRVCLAEQGFSPDTVVPPGVAFQIRVGLRQTHENFFKHRTGEPWRGGPEDRPHGD